MSFFHQKNQAFRTLDVVVLIALVAAISSIFSGILADAFQDNSPQRAQQTSELLARQLHQSRVTALQRERMSSANEGKPHDATRMLASDEVEPLLTSGELGNDPWGHRFHYFINSVSGPNGQKKIARVYVWSDGPNGRPDSDARIFMAQKAGERLHLRGDDIGYLEEFVEEGADRF